MQSLRIAAATSDGVSVCDHLARSVSFLVFQVGDGKVTSRTVRNRLTNTCGHHATFVELLNGCDAVLCGGIGQGAADSLMAHGIQPLVITSKMAVEDAIGAYLAGTLATSTERVCLCH